MPTPEERFARLARLTRRAPDTDATPDLPSALATRVLARLRSEQEDVPGIWEGLCLRAVPLAAVAAVACFFFLRVPSTSPDERRLAQSFVEERLAP